MHDYHYRHLEFRLEELRPHHIELEERARERSELLQDASSEAYGLRRRVALALFQLSVKIDSDATETLVPADTAG